MAREKAKPGSAGSYMEIWFIGQMHNQEGTVPQLYRFVLFNGRHLECLYVVGSGAMSRDPLKWAVLPVTYSCGIKDFKGEN